VLHIALVEPEIPWNAGNVGRTCLALGARLHLVAPLGFSLDARELRRAGLDYWPRVDCVLHAGFAEFLAAARGLGEPFLFQTGASRSLFDLPPPADALFLFGSESRGLPREVEKAFPGGGVRIPMAPASVRSLNLSSAVAVAGYWWAQGQ